ncbi:MAG: pyridoxine 5'-phosphate synthase [Nitrospinae bacterium]|nr:pyridoxine 5'-phosphate synthase [Nitrospinota bacterium]
MSMNLPNSFDFALKDYNYILQAFLVILLAQLANYLQKKVLARLLKQLKKTKTEWDDIIIIALQKPISLIIWVVGISFASEIMQKATGAVIFNAVHTIRDAGIIVSAFIEPIPQQIETSAEIGFHGVELWTGAFAHAKTAEELDQALGDLRRGIEVDRKAGLEVHGGHGLTYRNIAAVAALPGFSEFNIGHSIIARSIFTGLREAVREMKQLLTLHAPK